MRIVLDTASFVTALRSRTGAAAEVIRIVLRGKITSLMDVKLGLEYRAVALRSEHLAASKISYSDILIFIEAMEAVAEPVKVVRKPRPMSPDPNDDMVLDIAINGMADAIVTNNTKHFAAAATRFDIAVLTPAELLQFLRTGGTHAR